MISEHKPRPKTHLNWTAGGLQRTLVLLVSGCSILDYLVFCLGGSSRADIILIESSIN